MWYKHTSSGRCPYVNERENLRFLSETFSTFLSFYSQGCCFHFGFCSPTTSLAIARFSSVRVFLFVCCLGFFCVSPNIFPYFHFLSSLSLAHAVCCVCVFCTVVHWCCHYIQLTFFRSLALCVLCIWVYVINRFLCLVLVRVEFCFSRALFSHSA